jgi:hypothetical protein
MKTKKKKKKKKRKEKVKTPGEDAVHLRRRESWFFRVDVRGPWGLGKRQRSRVHSKIKGIFHRRDNPHLLN